MTRTSVDDHQGRSGAHEWQRHGISETQGSCNGRTHLTREITVPLVPRQQTVCSAF